MTGGVYWRRRALALAALGAAAAMVGALVGTLGGDDRGQRARAQAPPPAPPPPAELPRGGLRILPHFRVVAFYGAPQDPELGALGIGTPAQAARRLERVARGYRRLGRPVLPAMELLAVVANGDAGGDTAYSTRQPPSVIGRYLAAARRAKALLILDIQPGHRDFWGEALRLGRWLREPDVSLALDPEWHTPGAVPGRVIGSVDAREVNAISYWLDGLVRQRNLPQKVLLVHRFTDAMIAGRLKRRGRVAVTVNVDGFGHREIKRAKYEHFAYRDGLYDGFKLFFKEDTHLFTPLDVGRLRPRPDVIVYE
ncbi:MAG TPA: hypothetical protein VGJ32_09905 [Solirubrobacteraceae bacterium]